MKILNFLLGLFLMLAGILIDSMLYAFCECSNYVKTHHRLVVQEPKIAAVVPQVAKRNNWITHDQMEARREAKWQAQMKLVRDRKKEEQEEMED
ncbi:MAG: hypothetical protein P4L31_05455 [Candidatus Babeliales bacterium]|nr:hypothetical protein [Candidatus Babeliales bacterium]